ncbi:MAG: sigma factor-like helix-turn-helix DNA-binding protein [Anaerorhabdus sp.]|uniref:sigma factor-like helix-turn-helix DNA-binding protein n=1 Tax=Anaerorhabdus sp. TaxID=1872524 RepID=UPI003A854618
MLTKQEVKTILSHKVQLIRFDLMTYQSCKALIKAVEEQIQREKSVSLEAMPPTDMIVGGKLTGAKATEFDSAVEGLAITLADLNSERAGYIKTVERVDGMLEGLNETDRNILEKYFFHGMTYNMVAKEFKYEKGGIRKKIRRILEKLAKN